LLRICSYCGHQPHLADKLSSRQSLTGASRSQTIPFGVVPRGILT
jgi:hypothetical protein